MPFPVACWVSDSQWQCRWHPFSGGTFFLLPFSFLCLFLKSTVPDGDSGVYCHCDAGKEKPTPFDTKKAFSIGLCQSLGGLFSIASPVLPYLFLSLSPSLSNTDTHAYTHTHTPLLFPTNTCTNTYVHADTCVSTYKHSQDAGVAQSGDSRGPTDAVLRGQEEVSGE